MVQPYLCWYIHLLSKSRKKFPVLFSISRVRTLIRFPIPSCQTPKRQGEKEKWRKTTFWMTIFARGTSVSIKVYTPFYLPSNTRTHSGWLNSHQERRHLCFRQQHLATHIWAWQGTSALGSAEIKGDTHPSSCRWKDTCRWECSKTAARMGGFYCRIISPSSSQRVSIVHSEVPLPLSSELNHCKNPMFPEKSALSFLFIRSELSAGLPQRVTEHNRLNNITKNQQRILKRNG